MIQRRALLLRTAIFGAVSLTGCAGTTVSQLDQDVIAADNAATAVLTSFPASVAVPATVTSILTTIDSIAKQLQGASSANTGSLASQLLQAAQTGLPLVASFVAGLGPTGAAAAIGIAALEALAPEIAQLAGVTPAGAEMPTLAPPVRAAIPTMTASEARLRFYHR